MRFSRKSKSKAGDTNLISLVNIVFLILVFFMIMGRITPMEALSVDPPASENANATESGDITILVDSAGRVAVNSERVDRRELSSTLSKRMERSASPAGVVLKADAGTGFARLDEVLDEIRKLGVTRISLVTDTSR